MRFFWPFLAALVLGVLVGQTVLQTRAFPASEDPLSWYGAKVRVGMTHEQVDLQVGCPGVSLRTGDAETWVYFTDTEQLSVEFCNGVVVRVVCAS